MISFLELNVATFFTGFDVLRCEHVVVISDGLICNLGDVVSFSHVCASCPLLDLEFNVVIFPELDVIFVPFGFDVNLVCEGELVVVGEVEEVVVVDVEIMLFAISQSLSFA